MTASAAELLGQFEETFAAFRKATDAKHEELAKFGRVAGETAQRVEKIGADLDRREAALAARLDQFERRQQLEPQGDRGAKRDVAAEASMFSAVLGRAVTPEQFKAYTPAFGQYLRVGDRGLSAAMAADLSVGVDKNGGYLLKTDTTGRIITREFETSPMRELASVQLISTDKYTGPIDRDEADCGWVGDLDSRETETDTPEVGEWEIPVHELYAMPRCRQTLLDDAAIDVEAWLLAKVNDKLMRTENTAFCTGDGIKKPKGFLDYTTAATDDDSRTWGQLEHIVTGAAAAFHATTPGDIFHKLEGAMKSRYLANAVYAMRRSTRAVVRQMKDGQGNYLWQPDFQKGGPGMVNGYPVKILADMPALAANALPVAFGDFNAAYQIVDRMGVTVLRENITKKGWVKFYTVKRVGGAVVDFEALKLAKCST